MAKRLTPALEAATRNYEATALAWGSHRKVCHECHNAAVASRPVLACEAGFRLWQAVTRAGAAEARLRAPRAGQEQLALDGI